MKEDENDKDYEMMINDGLSVYLISNLVLKTSVRAFYLRRAVRVLPSSYSNVWLV